MTGDDRGARGGHPGRARQSVPHVSGPYLDSIALERVRPCLAELGKIIVVGKPSRSLGEVLLYLATLPNVIAYNPQARSLTLRRHPGLITLSPERVSITQVGDSDEGVTLLGRSHRLSPPRTGGGYRPAPALRSGRFCRRRTVRLVGRDGGCRPGPAGWNPIQRLLPIEKELSPGTKAAPGRGY